MTPFAPADSTPLLPRSSPTVGTVNQAVIDALLCRRWAELDKLVPFTPTPDPTPDLELP